MNDINETVIQRVINNIATEQEAVDVAAWLATEQGQAWVSNQIHIDSDLIHNGSIPLLEDINAETLMRRINKTIDSVNRRRLIFRAAAILIPAALILGMWSNLNNRLGGTLFSEPQTNETFAVMGERKEIIFQDGSKAFLNAQTKISYPQHFGLTERRIKLSGEAYFDVAHNPSRPFIVEVGDALIKVLGTSFNVKAYSDTQTVDILLVEGSVLFSCNNEHYKLAPSEKLTYNKSTGRGQIYTEDSAAHETLWRSNIICFHDAPLSEVISTLERWYDVRFEVIDPQVYKYTFSLRTPNIPISDLLAELQNIAPIRCNIDKESKVVKIKAKI